MRFTKKCGKIKIHSQNAKYAVSLTHPNVWLGGREPSYLNKSAENVTLTPSIAGAVDRNSR